MNKSGFYKQLCSILSEEQILCDEPMSRHTTFRVGGPADYFLTPQLEQAGDIIALCKEAQMPYQVIGNGSNLLVGDLGIRGVVVSFSKPAAQIQVQGNRLTAGAGTLLSQAAQRAYEEELGGMEFAAGIPGSVGGGIVMNAGAFEMELKNILVQAKVLTREGRIQSLSPDGLDLSYRHSCIPGCGMIVLEAEFLLQPTPGAEIKAVMDDYKRRRMDNQPLEYPSAGSIFKRPEDHFAGKVIMEAGLAGLTVGGAQVSAKHCGFIINTGSASAADILTLIHQVQQSVQERSGITLEMEVKCLGEFSQVM